MWADLWSSSTMSSHCELSSAVVKSNRKGISWRWENNLETSVEIIIYQTDDDLMLEILNILGTTSSGILPLNVSLDIFPRYKMVSIIILSFSSRQVVMKFIVGDGPATSFVAKVFQVFEFRLEDLTIAVKPQPRYSKEIFPRKIMLGGSALIDHSIFSIEIKALQASSLISCGKFSL